MISNEIDSSILSSSRDVYYKKGNNCVTDHRHANLTN